MDQPTPPMPVVDALTEPFWNGARDGQLIIQRCRSCGFYIHLPRPVCRRCQSFDLGHEAVSGRGEVYSFNIMHQVYHPGFAAEIPYAVVVVKLEEGARITSNVVGVKPHDIRCGMPVEVTFEEVENGVVLPKFRPQQGSNKL